MTTPLDTSQATPFLVVHQSRIKALQGAVLALVLFIVSIFMLLTPISPDEGFNGRIAHFLGAYGGPPAFGLFFIWSMMQLFNKKPLLVFDELGVTTRRLGLIPWNEISGVSVKPVMNRSFFGVNVHDVDAFANRFPASVSKNIHFNQDNMGMVVGVAEQSMPMKAHQLLAQVSDYAATHITEWNLDTNNP